jgi:hypothetical protein
MGVQRSVEKLIEDAVRAEVGRALGRAMEPIRAKVDEAIAMAVRRAAAPLEERLAGVVEDAAQRALDGVLEMLGSGKSR